MEGEVGRGQGWRVALVLGEGVGEEESGYRAQGGMCACGFTHDTEKWTWDQVFISLLFPLIICNIEHLCIRPGPVGEKGEENGGKIPLTSRHILNSIRIMYDIIRIWFSYFISFESPKPETNDCPLEEEG